MATITLVLALGNKNTASVGWQVGSLTFVPKDIKERKERNDVLLWESSY